MTVYLFTFHAYGSWMPDHPRGYVKRGQGIQAQDVELGERYRQRMKQEEIKFTYERQLTLVDSVQDICQRRGWRAHAIGTNSTHIHVLVSWADPELRWIHIRDTLKRLVGMLLSQSEDVCGMQWFSRKGSRKRVSDRDHFEYLIASYLPRHQGIFWSERDGLRL